MRWFVVIVLLAARVAHADCDPAPRSDLSIFLGPQRVVDRPTAPQGSNPPTPYFLSVGARWELGAEFDCDGSRFRLAFATSARSESKREDIFPQSGTPLSLHDDTKLQLGGELEFFVSDQWWVHVGAEKAVGENGYELALGARWRGADGFVGVDAVMTTPACDTCYVTPAIGAMVSAGGEGRSAKAAYISVAIAAAVALLGGFVYLKSNCDC